jgi:Cu+-exporting ATPase
MKITLRVPDMHCSNCAFTLEGLEDDLPGVRRVEASYLKQAMTVEFDENAVNLEDIAAAVRQLGYHPEIP